MTGSWRRLLPIGMLAALTALVAGSAALGAVQASSSSAHATAQPPATTTVPSSVPPPPATTTVPPPTPSTRLTAIAFFNPEHGYGVFTRTDGATCTDLVGLTSDGGVDFASPVAVTSWSCEASAPATSLAFDDHGDGFLYGPGLFVTHDGGNTWAQSHQPGRVLSVEARGVSIWMVETGCPTGGTPSPCPLFLLESSDGGRTWAPSPSLPSGATASPGTEPALGQTWLVRVSTTAAYLLANPGPANGTADLRLWFTTDAGASWSPRDLPCGLPALSVVLSAGPGGTLWAVCAGQPSAGYQGKVAARSSDGGRTWMVEENCLHPRSTCPSPLDLGYLGEVDAVSGSRAYLVGGRLPLLVTDDGGRSWLAVPFLGDTGGGTLKVIFFDAGHGLVLGDNPDNNEVSTLWATSDGGATWWGVVPSITPALPGSP